MVRVDSILDEDFIKYNDIFKIADMLFGWTREDSYKINIDGNDFILFGYFPIFMLFGYDVNGKIINKSCIVDENNKVVSITIDGYQINIYNNMIYLIDEEGRHQSVQMLKNDSEPEFEVSSNGLIAYMQYDKKRNLRVVLKYEQNVYGNNGVIYGFYLKDPFYVSLESNPIMRDKGLFFLGRKNSYYRMDFDIWNNKWQYDLATIGEYGLGAVMAHDTISLHGGQKQFSKYYKEIFGVGDYFSLTTFPIGKQYTKDDIKGMISELDFNSDIPSFILEFFNKRKELSKDFQAIIDEICKVNEIVKKK